MDSNGRQQHTSQFENSSNGNSLHWEILFADGEPHELRALPTARSMTVSLATIDSVLQWDAFQTDTVYYSLNPIQDDAQRASKATVTRRVWLLIDIDTVRPNKDLSATEAEKVQGYEVACAIVHFLLAMDWPAPIIVDSGNGWHLLYRIDLPNDKTVDALVKTALVRLATRFDTEHAKVDRSVHDAPRISKLPGSWARKGPDTPDRPHRQCKVVYEPESIEIVTREQLEALVGPPEKQKQDKPVPQPAVPNGNGYAGYVRSAIEGELIRVAMAPEGERNNALNRAAFSLGQLADWPEMDAAAAKQGLQYEGQKSGLGEREIALTVASGWAAGQRQPRERSVVHESQPPIGGHEGNGHIEAAGQPFEELPIEDLWPKIDKKAFYGLAGDVVWAIDPHTEADPIATLIQTLVSFGNLIGRNPYFVVTRTRHYAILNTVLVGLSALARKGTSWDPVREVMWFADDEWVRDHITGGLSSGEGLIHCLSRNEADARLLAVESEFVRVLKAASREASTLSAVIRQAFDGGDLAVITKNNPVSVRGAHFSLIGHTTQADLAKYLTDADMFNGTANRILWPCVRRSKSLPDPEPISDEIFHDLGTKLSYAKAFAHGAGKVDFAPGVRDLWIEIYNEVERGSPGLVGAITSRGAVYVRRMAMISALLNSKRAIEVGHLEAAKAIWDYNVASCQYIFRGTETDTKQGRILKALRENPGGLTQTEISVQVFKRNVKAEEMKALMSELLTMGLIAQLNARNAQGKTVTKWCTK